MEKRVAGLAVGFLLVASPPAPAADKMPLLVQVDHVVLRSPDAEQLFHFFRDDLELPEAWPFRVSGAYASGAVTLGNAALAFVADAGAPPGSARIAFEPVGDAAAAIAELDARGLPHGGEVPFTYDEQGKRYVGWSTVELDAIPPAGTVFIRDNKGRGMFLQARQAAAVKLMTDEGGALGVTSLREVVLKVNSMDDASAVWKKLAEFPAQAGLYAFGMGPPIRLEAGKRAGVERLVLGVKSAPEAREFLRSKKLLTRLDGFIAIKPEATGGLKITLDEE